MKIRIICLVTVLAACAVTAHAQSTRDVVDLTNLLKEFLDGASRNDASVHDRFWADDLIYTRSAGVRTNKPEMMKALRSARPPRPSDPKTVYTAEDIQIHQYGDAAVVAFRLVATMTKNGSADVSNYLNTGTFIKRNGRWQAVAWQSTVVPKTGRAK
jgi:ketosteroid isomerase-like protein